MYDNDELCTATAVPNRVNKRSGSRYLILFTKLERKHFKLVQYIMLSLWYQTSAVKYFRIAESRASYHYMLIKNYLRSAMSQERCSALALLTIENELTEETDFEEIHIIHSFSNLQSRRKF